jgi:hypothetical protein
MWGLWAIISKSLLVLPHRATITLLDTVTVLAFCLPIVWRWGSFFWYELYSTLIYLLHCMQFFGTDATIYLNGIVLAFCELNLTLSECHLVKIYDMHHFFHLLKCGVIEYVLPWILHTMILIIFHLLYCSVQRNIGEENACDLDIDSSTFTLSWVINVY